MRIDCNYQVRRKLIRRIIGVLTILSVLAAEPTYAAADVHQQATAIAFSACTFGTLDAENFPSTISAVIGIGLEYRLEEEGLLPSRLNIDLTEYGRIGYKNSVQGFTTSATLDQKWQMLPVLYEKAMQRGVERWKSGVALGVAENAANAVASAQILGLCTIAKSQIMQDSKKSKNSLKKWIIKAGGNLLPQLSPAAAKIK